ncbi:MAG: pelota family protein [Crenarchaeota archaeon]|nr:pelota family protein [Thermoproteota archaeon]
MKYDISKNVIEFEVEREEDLYVLYLIIDKGDLLYGWTVREFKTRKHEKGERRKIYICLKVEGLEYHAFRGSLRIRGVILEAPEWFDGIIGSHHTIEIIRGIRYKLVKESLDMEYVRQILNMFSKGHARALIISIGDEETTIAIAKMFGIDILASVQNKYSTSKAVDSDRRTQLEKYATEVVKQVKNMVRQDDFDYIIIAGPQRVLDYVKDVLTEGLKIFNKPMRTVYLSEGGLAGIYEIQNMAPDVLSEVLRLHELKYVDEIFERLVRGRTDVAIGVEEVERALEKGAVDRMLILDEYFKERGEEMKRLVSQLVKTGGSLIIVPSATSAGDKLRGLGGVAALLRYELSEQE